MPRVFCHPTALVPEATTGCHHRAVRGLPCDPTIMALSAASSSRSCDSGLASDVTRKRSLQRRGASGGHSCEEERGRHCWV
jgi:hypothetical protein